MKIGTKSVLFGAHCFLLHPIFVAIAWTKLYGFPLDPRLWIAFFVHDLGYWGKPNMDGEEGETHVELGAKIMHVFDGYNKEFKTLTTWTEDDVYDLFRSGWKISEYSNTYKIILYKRVRQTKWRDFSLYHSRYYAKKHDQMPSKLCFADKLSFCYTPSWLYLPMVNATREINEYLRNAKKPSTNWKPVEQQKLWHKQLCQYMSDWVYNHKDGQDDTWTNANRHAITDSGVTS